MTDALPWTEFVFTFGQDPRAQTRTRVSECIVILIKMENSRKREFCSCCNDFVSKTTFLRHKDELERQKKASKDEVRCTKLRQ